MPCSNPHRGPHGAPTDAGSASTAAEQLGARQEADEAATGAAAASAKTEEKTAAGQGKAASEKVQTKLVLAQAAGWWPRGSGGGGGDLVTMTRAEFEELEKAQAEQLDKVDRLTVIVEEQGLKLDRARIKVETAERLAAKQVRGTEGSGEWRFGMLISHPCWA